MGLDEILRHYVLEHERTMVLNEEHDGVAGGHYVGKATVRNILQARLWWPTMHADHQYYYRSCDVCQRTGKPSQRDEIPLVPDITL